MRAAVPLIPGEESGKTRSSALAVEALTKHFADLTAIESVSFAVDKGEFVALIGPSGCGKSTLFSIIGGLIGDYSGRVLVDGEPITGAHRAIGMVFQEESTFPW
ncbi:MAG TPA: ATP-binding cassette domain-containing protein, partial [Stellaceae bacterium]